MKKNKRPGVYAASSTTSSIERETKGHIDKESKKRVFVLKTAMKRRELKAG